MNKSLTLGSLFDGSGTFPMMGMMSGVMPVWASEIEPFPIAVTTKRLPFVKHLGDINHINGAEIEPVDIITFGSPCTDYAEKIVIPKKQRKAMQYKDFHIKLRNNNYGIQDIQITLDRIISESFLRHQPRFHLK